MNKVNLNNDLIDYVNRGFDEIQGLVGRVYDENHQVCGFYTSGKIHDNVYIALTCSHKSCKTKADILKLKVISKLRILSMCDKKKADKFMAKYITDGNDNTINRIENEISTVKKNICTCEGFLKNTNPFESFLLKKHNYELGMFCKEKNFLTRVSHYYESNCNYYFLEIEEIA